MEPKYFFVPISSGLNWANMNKTLQLSLDGELFSIQMSANAIRYTNTYIDVRPLISRFLFLLECFVVSVWLRKI